MKIQVINKSSNPLPQYAHPTGDSGMDLMADMWSVQNKFLFNAEVIRNPDNTIDCISIAPGGRALIPTEIYTAIPEGYEIQIRSRSGLALKKGVFVLNSPGTVDSSYRSSYGVILFNAGTEPFEVRQGDKIAQAVLVKVEHVEWESVETLDETDRGLGGFGSTGV